MRRPSTANLEGNMPPWHADPFYGNYSNDASLKPDEAAKLIQWIDAGAPRGSGPDPLADSLPPTITPTPGPRVWVHRTRSCASRGQNIPPTGTIDYRYLSVTNTVFTNDVWLRAAVARPGNSRAVHHCLVFEGDAASALGGWLVFFPATSLVRSDNPSRRNGEVA